MTDSSDHLDDVIKRIAWDDGVGRHQRVTARPAQDSLVNPMPMPVISISNLTKIYASGLQALKRIDLEIHKGEIFAALGPNTAGKTTLISIVHRRAAGPTACEPGEETW